MLDLIKISPGSHTIKILILIIISNLVKVQSLNLTNLSLLSDTASFLTTILYSSSSEVTNFNLLLIYSRTSNKSYVVDSLSIDNSINSIQGFSTIQILKTQSIMNKDTNEKLPTTKITKSNKLTLKPILPKNSNVLNIVIFLVNNITEIAAELKEFETIHKVFQKYKNTLVYILIQTENYSSLQLQYIRQQIFESGVFQSAHPYLTLIQLNFNLTTIISWMPICYLCNIDKQPFYIYSSNILPNIKDLHSILEKLNSNGEGKPAYTPRNPQSDLIPFRNAELSMRKTWKGGYTIKAITGYLSESLNFTFSSNETTRTPRLYVCSHCSPDQAPPIGNTPSISLLHINEMSFFYCRTTRNVESSSSLELIMNPFRTEVWICIFIGMILIGAIYKNAWLSLDIMWGIFSIPFVISNWRNPPKKSLLTAIITISVFYGLQFPYMAFFTSAVILPFPPLRIKTFQELFLTYGFRILNCNSDDMNDIIQHTPKNVLKAPVADYLIDTSDKETVCKSPFNDDTDLNGDYTEWSKFVPNKAVYFIQAKFSTRYNVNVQSVFSSFNCDSVKQVWHIAWVTINSNSHLSGLFRHKLTHLRAGGFDIYWESLFMAGVRREANKRAKRVKAKSESSKGGENSNGKTKSSSESNGQNADESPSSSSTVRTSPLYPLFKFCFWLLIFSTGIFSIELIYFYIRKYEVELKEGYKYLKGYVLLLKYYIREYLLVFYETIKLGPKKSSVKVRVINVK